MHACVCVCPCVRCACEPSAFAQQSKDHHMKMSAVLRPRFTVEKRRRKQLRKGVPPVPGTIPPTPPGSGRSCRTVLAMHGRTILPGPTLPRLPSLEAGTPVVTGGASGSSGPAAGSDGILLQGRQLVLRHCRQCCCSSLTGVVEIQGVTTQLTRSLMHACNSCHVFLSFFLSFWFPSIMYVSESFSVWPPTSPGDSPRAMEPTEARASLLIRRAFASPPPQRSRRSSGISWPAGSGISWPAASTSCPEFNNGVLNGARSVSCPGHTPAAGWWRSKR